MSDLIRWFDQLGMEHRPVAGGKGASLGELSRAGIRVPPGFVVTTAAFERFLAALDPGGTIRADIGGLDPADLDALGATAGRIGALMATAPLPPELGLALAQAHARLCPPDAGAAVAVRSSATSEDSAAASFAGLQDTFLWVRGLAEIEAALRRCWASLYSPASVGYRLRLGLPEQQVAMAVVIQRMADARCSGVMFTRSPLTGDRSVITIEASWGLGSCVVGGEVTPDRFTVNKVTGELIKRVISTKTAQHLPDPEAGGVRHAAVPEELQTVASLDEAELAELVRIGKLVERHYGQAQDIEWAIDRHHSLPDSVVLLQSRPETVWSSREAAPVARPAARPFDHVLGLLGRGRR